MRKTLAAAAVAALLVTGLAPTALAGNSIESGTGRLDAEVAATLASLSPGDMTTVVVTLRDQTDLAAVPGTTPAGRLKSTITALQVKANASQLPIRALLRARTAQGDVAGITPLWITNAISVTATAPVIRDLAARTDVASVTPDDVPLVPTIGTPEPNLTAVDAPALWDLGYTGQGVVVASLDTGVDGSHPDLASRWRGGANSWYDPYGQHPITPTDLSGHGTATMGVIVGGDAGGTSIGMAPGARWISAKIFNDAGGATATAIHQAFQWVLDPDHDPNTQDAPQVVNGSWSIGAGPGCDLSFQPDLQALRTAGILPVFAAGNFGSGGSSSVSPANYPEALAVGAVNNADLIYSASSRGPSSCGGRSRVFPDLVAPGVNVLTTDRYSLYQSLSGTSLSAPHAAGALALLLGAAPGLSPDRQQAALTASAFDLGPAGPDTAYGYGKLDVLAAYQWLLAQPDLAGPATMSATLTPSPTDGTADAVLHATGDDTATGGSNIASAEYFIDAVGVDGAGTSMTVNPAAPIASLDATIPAATLNKLAAGIHSVYVHAKDSSGNWGSVATTTLVIDKAKPVVTGVTTTPNPTQGANTVTVSATATDALATSDINRGEWFTGSDPGAGNGTPMTVTGPSPWSLTSAPIDVSSWAEGAYVLNVRARDVAGNWSLPASALLNLSTPLYFSTLGSTTVPGVAGTADDADVYSWSGTAYGRVIDASTAPYGLPGNANVDGYDRVDATHFYVSFAGNVTIPLPGPDLTVQDEDVVYYNNGSWSIYFDGTVAGLTAANQDLDAISIIGGTLYFSTVGNTNPPGVGGAADDADIYSWNGTAFARVWDASANGLEAAANVDGFVRVDATHFYLSFSADTTTVPVLGAVQDEDVVFSQNGVWSVYFNGTAHGLSATNLDVDAFDVPW